MVAGIAVCAASACSRKEEGVQKAAGPTVITAWAHAGQEAERTTIKNQVDRFNRRQDEIRIALQFIPEGSYNAQVQSAALAGELPDVLEFDGPFVYNYAWQGKLIPLDDLIRQETKQNLIDSIVKQGTYRGAFYSVGTFDSGLGLYGRRSLLEKAGVRIPSGPGDAWTVDEFETILADLAANDEDGKVLDLKLNYRGEWYTYAFSPPIQSAGGDLLNRSDYQSAAKVLNGPEAVGAMKRFQSWITTKGYVDPNVDDNAFAGGRVALSWVGHWEYEHYARAFPEDLVLLPLPDFGAGSRTGMGSWNWGITTRCTDRKAAMHFLEFLLEDRQILEMTKANAAVPATTSAIRASQRYQQGSPLHLFVTQLTEEYAVPRPRTPAYPVITSVFQQAFDDIRHGGNVTTALNTAVREIDRDIRDNAGYPVVE